MTVVGYEAGNTVLLRGGLEVPLLGVDMDSGWPIVQMDRSLIVAIDPVHIQEGWYDNDLND